MGSVILYFLFGMGSIYIRFRVSIISRNTQSECKGEITNPLKLVVVHFLSYYQSNIKGQYPYNWYESFNLRKSMAKKRLEERMDAVDGDIKGMKDVRVAGRDDCINSFNRTNEH